MKLNLKRYKFYKLSLKRLRWSSPIIMTVYFMKPDDDDDEIVAEIKRRNAVLYLLK